MKTKSIKNTVHKLTNEYSSISEFRSLHIFPETNPMILVLVQENEFLIEYANKPFIDKFGLTEKDNFELLNSDPNINGILKNLIHNQYSSFHFDFFYSRGNSIEPFFVEINRILIVNQEFFVINFASLEERTKIEQKINNLHNALEFGGVPVLILDIEGKVNYSTSSFEEILNKPISEIYKKKLCFVVEKIFPKGKMSILEDAVKFQKEIKEIISVEKNHKTQYFEFCLKPLSQSEKTELSFIVTATNVTDLIEREAVVRQSNKRKEEIINNIFEPIIILIEKDGKIFYDGANENFYKEFSVKNAEIVNKRFEDATESAFVETVYTAIDRISSEEENKLKFRYTHKKSKKEYYCKFSKFQNEHNNSHTLIISFFDITQQIENENKLKEAYEKEMRLNKMKSSFIANMSHEIRTPLNAIVGYSDLLADEVEESKSKDAKEMVTFLKEGVIRLLKLVDNIVDVSQVDSGEMQTDIHLYNVNQVIKIVIDELHLFAKEKQVKVDIHLDEDKKFIETDESHLRKILYAITENAIKYNIENGKVVIKTYVINKDLRIEIADTGNGISKEMLDEVLRPFSQQEVDGYRRRHEGAGLGLTLANKLTAMLGGNLEIHSEINNGTIVYLTFPEKKQ